MFSSSSALAVKTSPWFTVSRFSPGPREYPSQRPRTKTRAFAFRKDLVMLRNVEGCRSALDDGTGITPSCSLWLDSQKKKSRKMVENSVGGEKKTPSISVNNPLGCYSLSISIPCQSRRPIMTTQAMAVYTATHANAAPALPGVRKPAAEPSSTVFCPGQVVRRWVKTTDRRDRLETRHNVMMLMRIKQLVAVPS